MLGVAARGPLPVSTPSVTPSSDPGADATDDYAAERDAWTVLAAIDGLGPIALSALLERYGSGRAVLVAAGEPGGVEHLAATPSRDPDRSRIPAPVPLAIAEQIAAATQDGVVILDRVRAFGLRVVTMEEPAYPRRLAAIAMPPHLLFVRGDAAALARPRAVAVVGTRHATTAGRTTAGRIATALAAVGATVVSGLAIGIDGAAHEATVRAGGTTVAVIGGGHANLSPSRHDRLADAIVAAGGAVISEHAPDVVPSVGTFPRRNRVISGLSDATVVVEAPARSGALITASWALEQSRGCFLVPGPIDAPASAGCLSLLHEAPEVTRIVTSIPGLIADLGYAGDADLDAPSDPLARATIAALGRTEAAVAAALVAGHHTVDELVAVLDLPVATVLATLALLERRGLVAGVHGRYRPDGELLGDRGTRPPR
jgi:DNA processing protein